MKTIRIIPSKSDAHRALICAALSKTPCKVLCEATSKDLEATKACLAALAHGEEAMYCGESGSTLRFLLPVMGALGHKAAFYPEGRLPERPLSPLYEELEAHGCRLSKPGRVPFVLEGQLLAGDYRIPGNVSSQYISGLLIALPLLAEGSRIFNEGPLESAPYVDMTITTLTQFGIKIEKTSYGYDIPGGQKYKGPDSYQVEGDWSNGCFWLVAGALGENGLEVTGLSMDSAQGDKRILELLQEMGAEISIHDDRIQVRGGNLKGITIDASQIPDMVPVLAVAALAAEGTTEIKNAGRLRIKESDRLASISSVLQGLGGDVEELAEGLLIKGGKPLSGGIADAHNDHRIAMMATIAALLCEGDEKVIIQGADAVNKSYPGFYEDLAMLGLDQRIERK